ncbi:MAG: glycosyltransferase, partial [Candidatus Margulisiibacteriota bacterium]
GIAGLLGESKALVFASLEDFRITPLEAQSAGRPVITLGKGGALETVINGKTGVYFKEQTAESVILAVKKFQTMCFDKFVCRDNAKRFSREIFKEKMAAHISAKIKEHGERLRK